MLALDTEGDLLLISAKELSNNSYELTIHKMDKTILAGEDAAFTEENLILDQTISTGDIYNRYSPLQSLVIQSQDSFWIKEDAGHITEVDISSNTVRSYEAPNGFDSFAFDIESNKLLAISEYSNDSDREYSDLHESDLNVCSVSK